MNGRKFLIITVIAICVFSLAYGIYYEISRTKMIRPTNDIDNGNSSNDIYDFDALFDNNINYQGYSVGSENKQDTSKEIVYTIYKLNQSSEGKYDINVELPYININNKKIIEINREIITLFGQKVQSILSDTNTANKQNVIYTVEYTSCVNENILSVVIKSTLKEGSNAQRLIIQAYTYNLSSNEIIPLKTMIEIKGLDKAKVREQIRRVVQEGSEQSANLSALGYNVFVRDLNSDIYEIENSNNYYLGPNGTIYIIYAYGNTRYTSEKDIVIIR